MSEDHSITQYITGLCNGDSVAANQIMNHYYTKLFQLAQKKLQNCPRRVLDEDDVVQVAFENFFRQVQEGRFTTLNDRNDLWQILAMLVDRRAKDQFRRLTAEKNGKGKVRGDSINKRTDQQPVIEVARDFEPTAEQAMEFAEEVELRLSQLDFDVHRQVALLKMDRYTNRQIADKLDVSLRTVERILESIRKKWSGGQTG